MWKQPYWLTDQIADFIWKTVKQDSRTVNFTFSNLQTSAPALFTNQVLKNTFASLKRTYPHGASGLLDFKTDLEAILVTAANEVAQDKRFDEVPAILINFAAISGLLREAKDSRAEPVGGVAALLAAGIQSLLGTENMMLVGTRGNTPAFKPSKLSVPRKALERANACFIMTFGQLYQISQADVGMLPDWETMDLYKSGKNFIGTDYLELNSELIEKAFYNQRYLIDEKGALIELHGLADFKSILIKIRANHNDELVDILAKVTTNNGSFLTIISEEKLMNSAAHATEFPSIGSYVSHLICQVYHDLVTADEFPRNELADAGRPAKNSGNDDTAQRKLRYRVIPRKIRGQTRQPRHLLPVSQVREPVAVTGHRRKVRMSDQQRQRLIEFEQEHNLVILRFVPPGETFVLPHFSPKLSPGEFKSLPRFIRYRVQQSLQRTLSQETPDA